MCFFKPYPTCALRIFNSFETKQDRYHYSLNNSGNHSNNYGDKMMAIVKLYPSELQVASYAGKFEICDNSESWPLRFVNTRACHEHELSYVIERFEDKKRLEHGTQRN